MHTLQVLVVPLALKPLFPGGIMPVTVTNNKLIKELFEIRKSGWVCLIRRVALRLTGF